MNCGGIQWQQSIPTRSVTLAQLLPRDGPNVAVDLILLNLVEDKHVCWFGQQRETEAFSDPWLRVAGDEELDHGVSVTN